ncbi:MAG: hypothetical protein ABIP48_08065, partial [Planctomycetota bacterium]
MAVNQPLYNTGPPPRMTAVGPICSGQLIAFTPARAAKLIAPPDFEYRALGGGYSFVGRVLTMRHGVAEGKSTRIVGYDALNDWLLILPFEDVATADFLIDVQNINPLKERREYIINGTPFSGTGFGYNFPPTWDALLDAPLPILPTVPPDPPDPILQIPSFLLRYALLPNRLGDPSVVKLEGAGGANEGYDAVDYQNMLLAMVLPSEDDDGDGILDPDEDLDGDGILDPGEDLNGNGFLDPGEDDNGDGRLDLDRVPIPSLHRPALINYWYHRLVDDWLTQPLPNPNLSTPDAWRAVLQPVLAGPPPYGTQSLITAETRDAIIALKRRIFFRPLRELHDQFTGSNPEWDAWRQAGTSVFSMPDAAVLGFWQQGTPLIGPWDVDNDGDGIRDSIWVDLGMPVQTDDDGRRYRPLFAILCADMDGRLNVNAHGSLAHGGEADDNRNLSLDPSEDHNHNGFPDVYRAQVAASPLAFAAAAGASPTAALPRGQGYGPPEINLGPLFNTGDYLEDRQEMLALMLGAEVHRNPANPRWVDGRYGEAYPMATPGDVNLDFLPDDFREVQPGRSFAPGTYNRDDLNMLLAADPLARNKHFQLASFLSYNDNLTPLGYTNPPDFPTQTAYGTPPDFKATMAIGLDVRGLPMYWTMVDPGINSRVAAAAPVWFDRFAWTLVNSPYELDLSRNATRAVRTPARLDHPYSAYELERVLRQYDFDAAGLADRLPLLAPALLSNRSEITTDSWDVPTPGVAGVTDSQGISVPPAFRRFASGHFADLLTTRVSLAVRARPDLWSQLVAPELLAGLRMNLNRPFGNGLDDLTIDTDGDGIPDARNGVVDEAGLLTGPNWQTLTFDATVSSEVADLSDPTDPTTWVPLEKVPLVDATGNLIVDASGNPIILFDHCNGVDVDSDGNDLNNDGVADPDRIAVDRAMARELYARHLYTLAIMLSDDIYNSGNLQWPAPPAPDEAMRLAQWAVNVVDFRDRDSIMTRFNFDRNPLDGWNPVAADVVWGCERPELQISETMAIHDRRTQDLSSELNGTTTTDPNNPDGDFDQQVHPQGS